MPLKLKLIIALAFMAGEFTAYAIASSPWSPISMAEASTLSPQAMLVSECALPRTPEFIRFEQIVSSMDKPRPQPKRPSTPHLAKPEPHPVYVLRPKPRPTSPRLDPVASLIAGSELSHD